MNVFLVAEFLSSFQSVIDTIKGSFEAIYSIIQPFIFEDGFVFFQIALGAWAIIIIVQFITSFKGG